MFSLFQHYHNCGYMYIIPSDWSCKHGGQRVIEITFHHLCHGFRALTFTHLYYIIAGFLVKINTSLTVNTFVIGWG